jgi:tetratricopeptide (TPR) repeat protein
MGRLTRESWLMLGDAYAKSGHLLEAEAVWRGLFKSGVEAATLYERIIDSQMAEGLDLQAIDTLEEWSKTDPDNAQVVYKLGLLMAIYTPRQASIPIIQASRMSLEIKIQSNDLLLALSSLAQDDVDEARDLLVSGRALGNMGRWDLAIKAFRRAVELKPNYAEAWALLGEAEQETGKDGFPSLQKALALDPQSNLALFMLAIYWRRQNKPELAFTYFQQLSLQEPEKGIWQVEMGNTMAEMGDISNALRYFQMATKVEPGNGQMWIEMARFCVFNGIEVRSIALPAARESLLISPDDSEALDLMGWIFMSLGDEIGAERFLSRAIEMDALNASAQLHMAQLYLEEENFEGAHEHLSQAIGISDESEPVGKLARRLLEQYFQTPN